MSDPVPVVSMDQISVSFPSGWALDRADFRLYAGEVHALMGENGAGKSTLVKALTGVYQPVGGEVRVDGEVRRFHGPGDARTAGIEAVFQDERLIDNLSVGESMMLGHEVRGRWGISWRGTHRRAMEVLAELGLGGIDSRMPLRRLPPGTRQLVAIGRAIASRPRVLLLDEPTSSLDERDVLSLFTALRRLRDSGVAIVFVSHFLEQVLRISDRMTILRDGATEGEYVAGSLDRAELIAKMIGKDIDALRAIGSERREHRVEPTAPAMLRAVDLGRRGAIAPTDLELHRGEIVGFAGLRGSGRTELASLLSGAQRADSGRILLDGAMISLTDPSTGLRNRIAHSSENRREEGVIGELSVRENLVLGLQSLRGWARPISRAESDHLVASYLGAFDISPVDPDLPAKFLSGGNQQKILLARWLAMRPRVLILDEPIRGVDISSKVEIQSHISRLAAEGVSMVLISSELDEIVRLSDRIVVFKDRAKIGEVSNGPSLTVDTIVEMIAGDVADDDD